MVCCTQYVAGRWSGNGDHRPATYWVQHNTSCITQSKSPEDGQNFCPKHVELNWIYQWTKVIVASSWLSSLPSLLMMYSQTSIKSYRVFSLLRTIIIVSQCTKWVKQNCQQLCFPTEKKAKKQDTIIIMNIWDPVRLNQPLKHTW